MDDMWRFVRKKHEPRWLWHAIDHGTGAVLAYVLGRRKDEVFLKLTALLEPFGLTRSSTDLGAPTPGIWTPTSRARANGTRSKSSASP
jgi:IS1 family transposase